MSSNVFPILSSSPPPMDGPVAVEPYPMLSSSPPPMDMPEVASNEDDFGGFQECPSYNFDMANGTENNTSDLDDFGDFHSEIPGDEWSDFPTNSTATSGIGVDVTPPTQISGIGGDVTPPAQSSGIGVDAAQTETNFALPEFEQKDDSGTLSDSPDPKPPSSTPDIPSQQCSEEAGIESCSSDDSIPCDTPSELTLTFHSHCDSSDTNMPDTVVPLNHTPGDSNTELVIDSVETIPSIDCSKSDNTCSDIESSDKPDLTNEHAEMLDSNSSRDSGLCSDASDQKLNVAETVEHIDNKTCTDITNEQRSVHTQEDSVIAESKCLDDEDEFLAFQDATQDTVIDSTNVEPYESKDSSDSDTALRATNEPDTQDNMLDESVTEQDTPLSVNAEEQSKDTNSIHSENSLNSIQGLKDDSSADQCELPLPDITADSDEDNQEEDETFGSFKDTSHMTDLQFRTSSVDCEPTVESSENGISVLDNNADDDNFSSFPDPIDGEFTSFAGPNDDTEFTTFGNAGGSDAGEDDGDWAAFATADDHQEKTSTIEDKADDEDGEWAAFSEPATVQSTTQLDNVINVNDDEFTSFDDAQVTSDIIENTIQDTLSTLLKNIDDNKLNGLLCKGFPTPDINGNTDPTLYLLQHITQVVKRTRPVTDQPLLPARGREKTQTIDISVWNNLKDLESTDALQYTWSKSDHNRKLLTAINIDTRNILGRKKAVPIYASQMSGSGMLTPLTNEELNEQSSVTMVTDSNGTTAGTPNTQDIPPVEFDWSSSGLTNPLDSSDLQLDLDFFQHHSSVYTATSPTAALENELLKSIEPNPQKQPKTLQPLNDVIASMKITPTAPASSITAETDNNLTCAGQELIINIPDISYMCSSVLMFSIKKHDSPQ